MDSARASAAPRSSLSGSRSGSYSVQASSPADRLAAGFSTSGRCAVGSGEMRGELWREALVAFGGSGGERCVSEVRHGGTSAGAGGSVAILLTSCSRSGGSRIRISGVRRARRSWLGGGPRRGGRRHGPAPGRAGPWGRRLSLVVLRRGTFAGFCHGSPYVRWKGQAGILCPRPPASGRAAHKAVREKVVLGRWEGAWARRGGSGGFEGEEGRRKGRRTYWQSKEPVLGEGGMSVFDPERSIGSTMAAGPVSNKCLGGLGRPRLSGLSDRYNS
jgi:hypothetical protein